MHVLNIVTSPRKDQSASRALVDAFLREYMKHADDIVVDTLDVWQEWLPEFDAETIDAKYKGASGGPMTPAEVTAWEKIGELVSRFQSADRIVMDQSTIGQNLRPLERDGLISLHQDVSDRRRTCVKLAKKGRDRLAAARPLWAGAQERLENFLGTQEAAQLRATLLNIAYEPLLNSDQDGG
jgi:hypothetical protein